MSDFVEYKPMDVEHNVKAAVENLRKAYWSNDTEKVAKIFTDAESIIVSAICHDTYIVCKPDAERPQGDLISREALKKQFGYNDEWYKSRTVTQIIDNAPPVETYTKDDMTREYLKGYNACKDMNERPQGEWIKVKENRMSIDMPGDIVTQYRCSKCGRVIATLPSKLAEYYPFCHCGADMWKGGAE